MREIKFRGKCSQSKRWVYGFLYISNISGCYILQCVSFAKKTKEGMNLGDKVVEFEVNPETVRQYTGLKTRTEGRFMRGILFGVGAVSNVKAITNLTKKSQ